MVTLAADTGKGQTSPTKVPDGSNAKCLAHSNALSIRLPKTVRDREVPNRSDAYRIALASPQVKRAEPPRSRRQLDQEFRRANTILKERLDTWMQQFKTSNVDFHNAYANARQVIDAPGSSPPPPPP